MSFLTFFYNSSFRILNLVMLGKLASSVSKLNFISFKIKLTQFSTLLSNLVIWSLRNLFTVDDDPWLDTFHSLWCFSNNAFCYLSNFIFCLWFASISLSRSSWVDDFNDFDFSTWRLLHQLFLALAQLLCSIDSPLLCFPFQFVHCSYCSSDRS